MTIVEAFRGADAIYRERPLARALVRRECWTAGAHVGGSEAVCFFRDDHTVPVAWEPCEDDITANDWEVIEVTTAPEASVTR